MYTDGSARWTESKDTAQAGWGVYFGDSSGLNKGAPLAGPIQSSYRAELRAALHVAMTAGVNVMIMADCKAVVTQFQKILEGESVPKDIADKDLWDQVVKYAGMRKDRI